MAILSNYLEHLQEAGFKEYPPGWTSKSVEKFAKTLVKGGASKKDFFDKCVDKMKKHMKDPEGFCASIKDEVYGSDKAATYWRGKGKTKEEAEKDIARERLKK